jgi:glutamate formiminotransferase
MDRVKKECEAKKISIRNTELVGLVPKDATFPGMKESLMLDDFDEGKILETYL